MKRLLSILPAFVLAASLACACCDDKHDNGPDWSDYINGDEDVDVPGVDTPPSEPGEYVHKPISDMVLIYGGSTHRTPFDWSTNYLQAYVTYRDKDGQDHWLFDGFLFLEFMLAQYGKTLVTGYQLNGEYLPSATKDDWQALADYYFKKGSGCDALENAIKTTARDLGAPPTKRKVVIGIPEPIKYYYSNNSTGGTTYWGELGDVQMDFSITEHRILAVEWYISYIRELFEAKNYQYIELDGFYWVPEKAINTRDICEAIGKYLNSFGLSFNWIPYYTANGYAEWESLGFNQAYLQPNYFFNDGIAKWRLESACGMADEAGMGMEVEFDGKALNNTGWGYRLYDYLDEFKRLGVWEKSPLAYYQGSWALKWLRDSTDPVDKELYYYFGDWLVSRPTREAE